MLVECDKGRFCPANAAIGPRVDLIATPEADQLVPSSVLGLMMWSSVEMVLLESNIGRAPLVCTANRGRGRDRGRGGY